MDRSIYGRREAWGTFAEQSTNTPGFQHLVATKQQIPNRDYFFRRVDGISPESMTYDGPRTERQAAGIRDFYSSCRDGYYVLQQGAVQGSRFLNIDELHGILRNKLIAKVRDSPIDLGVSLGEYRETANFLTGAIAKTTKAARQLKKFKFDDAIRTVAGYKRGKKEWSDAAKAAADAHLGFTYAVKPIISDVSGAIEKLAQNDNPWIGVKTIHAAHNEAVFSEGFYRHGQYHTAAGFVSGSMKGSAKLHFFVDNPLLFTAEQLGLLNAPALLWELLPLSFVADWFFETGALLQGVKPPAGVSNVKFYTYVKGKGGAYQQTDNSHPLLPPGWHTYGQTQELFKSRIAGTEWPWYSVQRPDLSLSKSQIGSALALLAQVAR